MILALATASFVVFGGLLVLVGASQDGLATLFAAPLERIGLLAAAVSLGLGTGIVAAGPLADRYPRRPLFVAASLLAAFALAAAARATDVAWLALALAAAGFGAGGYETVLNAVLSGPGTGASHLRTDQRLTIAHLGATVGAVAAPLAIAGAIAGGGVPSAFLGLAAAFAALGTWGLFVRWPAPGAQVSGDGLPGRIAAGAAPEAGSDRLPARLLPAVLPFLVAGLAYVGFETAATAFATPIARSMGVSAERGVVSISAFYLGLMVGRLALLAWPRPAGPGWLVASAAFCLIAAGVGVATGAPPELLFAAAGIALGPTFPLLMALTAARFGERRGTAMGLVAGAGAGGGALIPWLAGGLGDRLGPAAILAVLGGCCLLLGVSGLRLRPGPAHAAPRRDG